MRRRETRSRGLPSTRVTLPNQYVLRRKIKRVIRVRMDRALKRTCITVRRAGRHPVIQRSVRSGVLLRKHVIRATTLSMVPSTVNDVIFHHAHLDVNEVLHTASDSVSIGTMNAIVALISIASKAL